MTDTTPVPTNGTANPPAKLQPMDAMRITLTRMEKEFACALPPQIPVQKFIRTTITAVGMNPDLLGADRRSLLAACMKAAQDGLLVDGREAALVIFRGKGGAQVQYMPMIGGLLKKLRNSGELSTISAHVAYSEDEFIYELGDNERIVHVPTMGPRGKPIAAYAIAKTKGDAIYREVMSVAQIEQVRAVSRAKDNGPWVQWWDEMARKTVLRRMLKRMPSSADVDALLEADNETNDLGQSATSPTSMVTGGSEPVHRLKAAMQIESDGVRDAESFSPAQDADLVGDQPNEA